MDLTFRPRYASKAELLEILQRYGPVTVSRPFPWLSSILTVRIHSSVEQRVREEVERLESEALDVFRAW